MRILYAEDERDLNDLVTRRLVAEGYRCHIRQVVQILHQIDPKHPFQIVGLISALSFVIARSDQADPFSPRYDSVDLC